MSEEARPQTNRQQLIYGPAERNDSLAIERIRNDLRTGGPTLGDSFTLPPSGDINIAPLPGTSLPTTPLPGGGGITVVPPAFFYATVDTFDGSTQLGTATRVDDSTSINYRNTTGRVLAAGDTVLVSEVAPEFLVVAVYSVSGGYPPISFVAPSNVGYPFNGATVSDGMYTDSFNSSGSFLLRASRFGIVVDSAGSLGFGAGTVLAIHNDSSGSPKVVARNPNTGTSHSLGSIGMGGDNESNVMLEVAGPYLLAIGNGYSATTTGREMTLTNNRPIWVWDQVNGWRFVGNDAGTPTTGGSGTRFGWIRIGTDYYVTRSTGSTGMAFVDLDTLTSTSHTVPSAFAVLARDQWMWMADGRVAAASLSPSWSKPYSFSYTQNFSFGFASIGDAGELRVFRTFPGAGAGIETYLFDPSGGGPWSESGLFSATGLAADGEPQGVNQSRIVAGDGVIGVAGWVRADFVDPTLDNTEFVGAVWVTDGFTGSSIILLQDVTGYVNGTSDFCFSGVAVNGRTVTGIVGGKNGSGAEYSYVDSYTF